MSINDDNTWKEEFHENAKETIDYWHFNKGRQPVLKPGLRTGLWQLADHTLIMQDEQGRELKRIELIEPGVVDGLYYPDPNDESGNEVRHFWKCGKCGCK